MPIALTWSPEANCVRARTCKATGLLGSRVWSSRAADSADSVRPSANNKSTLAMEGRRSLGSASEALSSQLKALSALDHLPGELRQAKHRWYAIGYVREDLFVTSFRVSLITSLFI